VYTGRFESSIDCLTNSHFSHAGSSYCDEFSTLRFSKNYCSLVAYQLLSPIAYNVLNQTKTISAAFWCYILMGRKQSSFQMVALALLVAAAVVMENPIRIAILVSKKKGISAAVQSNSNDDNSDHEDNAISRSESNNKQSVTEKRGGDVGAPAATPATSGVTTTSSRTVGLIAILSASMISGLAGAWIQRSLQMTSRRNSLLLTMELAFFSTAFLLTGLCITFITTSSSTSTLKDSNEASKRANNDAIRIVNEGWWSGWTRTTWIPCLTNAAGGILVGMVTKVSLDLSLDLLLVKF